MQLFSSLTKVFCDRAPSGVTVSDAVLCRNEAYALQAVFFAPQAQTVPVCVRCDLPLTVYAVGQVTIPRPEVATDGDVLGTAPGQYPDVLWPIAPTGELPVSAGWHSLFIRISGDLTPGTYPLTVTVGGESASARLTVLPVSLPSPTLDYTAWFHCDCLADRYNEEPFSDRFWTLLERYFRNAAAFGQTMLLVPLFTPPLDTPVGSERRTVQLVHIRRENGQYAFDFSLVGRYIRLALDCGFTAFEMPHLFTQWGAAAAPKIVAEEHGVTRRIFGWDTPSDADSYRAFLAQLLPAVRQFLAENGWLSRCVFHYSDEPDETHLTTYCRAREGAAPFLTGCRTMDALSSYAFYARGLLDIPVVATSEAAPFLANGVDPLWVYYCCGQTHGVCNRFVRMPSYRNRALGFQLYTARAAGFLHWGYNDWYNTASAVLIDPFSGEPADADAYPAGDGYVVYPGADGPLPSLRQAVFAEALQDRRLCELAASLSSRDAVLSCLTADGCRFTFDDYPHADAPLLTVVSRLKADIAARL